MKKVLVMGQLKEQIIPPPTRLVITLRDFRASNIMLVIEKTLFWTDVSSSHARFSIPKNQVRSEFLTDEEKVKIERELLEVKVLDPEDQWWDLHFKQWKMEKKEDVDKNKKKGKTTYTYVLSRYWKNLLLLKSLDFSLVFVNRKLRREGLLNLSTRSVLFSFVEISTSMKDSQSTPEVQSSAQVSHESHSDQQNNTTTEAPVVDSGSISISSYDSKKVSREDIELVQNLIERCLQLYMNKDEVVKTLLNRARIEPGFTTLVWQKLEEENAEFFRAYYTRLKLKKQIILFNHLLEHQYHLMNYPPKVPLAPLQNGIHPMPVQSTIYLWDTPLCSSRQLLAQVSTISSRWVAVYPAVMCMVMDSSAADVAPVMPLSSAMSSMSEMAVSPTSVASSGHFPFTPSEMSGMGVDTSALDTAFTSDVASSVGLQLGPDGGAGNFRDSLRSLAQIPWNFSLSDLTADLSNLGDLGALGNYPGSPFLPSDSDLLLDSPEQDDIVEEFFVDSVPGPCSQSDEEKS
ncbi:hypothetical protein HHK36_029128 [Tetracentron sinense]|uniref:Uncharacterized protein n=1 Tax=Tetracentron sinense TaxID=13715 RepID=A0A834YEC7_TETSI|nr:hypothetical protein HHK36_029128 [Tetracentron sinense]